MCQHWDMASVVIRPATQDDTATILQMINALADYEKRLHESVGTEEQIREHLFGENRYARVLLAEDGDRPVGFALYFFTYSTFLARPTLYIEDLFVLETERGKGIGKKLFAALGAVATDHGCGRMEWSVLDWNTPAIAFYKSLGAFETKEWLHYRLLAENFDNLK
jgi:GNAT superfamily N-acetyltransferase